MAMRGYPSGEDWSLAEIAKRSPSRAAHLERAGPPEELVSVMAEEMAEAIANERVRFGVDSLRNEGAPCRAIVQFQVSPTLYDWFFNGPSGYRAQFWMSAEAGLDFNRLLVEVLAATLGRLLPASVPGRAIEVSYEAGREERDTGLVPLERDFLLRSLQSPEAKAWICERLIQPDGRDPAYLGAIIAATRMPKLGVARWLAATPRGGERGEGARAPFADPEDAWIDIKGGFVQSGTSYEGKSRVQRANDLHETGWT